jgi:hypothetical protein
MAPARTATAFPARPHATRRPATAAARRNDPGRPTRRILLCRACQRGGQAVEHKNARAINNARRRPHEGDRPRQSPSWACQSGSASIGPTADTPCIDEPPPSAIEHAEPRTTARRSIVAVCQICASSCSQADGVPKCSATLNVTIGSSCRRCSLPRADTDSATRGGPGRPATTQRRRAWTADLYAHACCWRLASTRTRRRS